MLKNILNLKGTKELSKENLLLLKGGNEICRSGEVQFFVFGGYICIKDPKHDNDIL